MEAAKPELRACMHPSLDFLENGLSASPPNFVLSCVHINKGECPRWWSEMIAFINHSILCCLEQTSENSISLWTQKLPNFGAEKRNYKLKHFANVERPFCAALKIFDPNVAQRYMLSSIELASFQRTLRRQMPIGRRHAQRL